MPEADMQACLGGLLRDRFEFEPVVLEVRVRTVQLLLRYTQICSTVSTVKLIVALLPCSFHHR